MPWLFCQITGLLDNPVYASTIVCTDIVKENANPAIVDPDRMILATARRHDAALATRDQSLLACSRAGHLKVIEA